MLLSRLLESTGYKGKFKDREISFITDNSENVTSSSLFVCIKGARGDGHRYGRDAARKGAVIVCEHSIGVSDEIIVKDTRRAYADFCGAFFSNPARRIKFIGITGTNGKTTTAFLLKDIFEKNGYKCGLVGTVQDMAGDAVFYSERTTPDSFELNCLFSKMVKRGCEYCIMEVSSQALSQGRVDGLSFDCAVFTNLTQDHLDYHGTFENYAKAKKKLFSMCRKGIINIDDEKGLYMTHGEKCQSVTYSLLEDSADYTAKNIVQKSNGTEYEIIHKNKSIKAEVGIPGLFSVYNSLAAIVCASQEGIPLEKAVRSLKDSKGVKGRAEVVPTNRDFTVIIDYAHTPDSLENILKTIKGFAQGRIITVFGCGGDRDKAKRPVMGEIAVKFSDYLIVTSDNPRSENPQEIIKDILKGCKNAEITVETIENRRKAIERALAIGEKDDIILLAGKGHETYQILGDKKIHFDEREIVSEYLNREVSR